MKTVLKTTFIVGVFLFAFKSYAQAKHVNQLTLAAYDGITINGVNWNAIPNGYEHNNLADIVHKMEKLFGKHRFSITKGTMPSLYIDFSDGAIFFSFEDRSDTGNNYGIVLIRIHKNTWNIRIKGTTLTIGDPIGKLGQVKTFTNDDGTKSIFFDCETCDAEGWSIDFDSNDRIEEISYMVFD